jgi:hypothetical protein
MRHCPRHYLAQGILPRDTRRWRKLARHNGSARAHGRD